MLRIVVPTVALMFGAAFALPAAAQSGVDLVKASVEAQGGVAAMPDQKLVDRSLPAVSIKSGVNTFVVLFDPATKLPAAIRTRDADAVYGDSNYDMIPSDWKDVAGGGKRAHTLSFRLNGTEV